MGYLWSDAACQSLSLSIVLASLSVFTDCSLTEKPVQICNDKKMEMQRKIMSGMAKRGRRRRKEKVRKKRGGEGRREEGKEGKRKEGERKGERKEGEMEGRRWEKGRICFQVRYF